MFVINILSYFLNCSPVLYLFASFGFLGVFLCLKRIVIRK